MFGRKKGTGANNVTNSLNGGETLQPAPRTPSPPPYQKSSISPTESKQSHTTKMSPEPEEGDTDDELQTTVQKLNEQKSKVSQDGQIEPSRGVVGRVSTIVMESMVVAGPLNGVPCIHNAIQVLDQLSDLGKALPFVAPAFIILKIIVDIEKNARYVDAKCNDLLERITFMLGHLPALRRVQVTDGTRQVIERMNGVLKTAASLIQAYRKQGVIARRLNVGNKDKFTLCAEAINTCSSDLMISLQIHQTGQLDILTRSVPVDPEDVAAQTFITDHGGINAVKGDPELVTQFANELHLKMDDKVMEQLHTNLADLMQQNQAQLERALNENVNAAVVDGIKGLAAQMHEAEKEQTFKCVQCNREYRNSTNGPTSCSFHRGEYSSWDRRYPCCSTPHPCQVGTHRASHHCDFPYGTFFVRSRNILNYVDTVDDWASVKDTNLESNDSPEASIGRLLRWVSRGDRIVEPIIVIRVGTVWYTEPYFFDTFTPSALESVAKAISVTHKTTIFRTSPSESEFAMAEWVLSPAGVITGVRLTAKAATSESPCIQLCPIDPVNCTKSGDIVTLTLSEGLRTYKPEAPYVLPETIRVGPELSDKPARPVRTDFKTHTSSAFPVILKATSEPPLTANPNFVHSNSDKFEGAISVFNKSPAGSTNPITIASVSACFRLVGDPDYTPVKSFKILNGLKLPVTIDPRRSSSFEFEAVVPRSEEDILLGVKWWHRAFVSRKRPLRLKVTLEDIEGEVSSIVLDHVYTPYPFEKPKDDDLAFFYFDDPELCTRNSIHVTKATGDDGVVSIGGIEVKVNSLHKTVYQAIKTGETEIDLAIGQERESGVWEWAAWALVDLSCRRVYAFKVLLKQGRLVSKKTLGCLGYVPCPDYGDPVNESRPIRYAVEKVKLPDFEPLPNQEFVTDDTIDDIIPEPPKPVEPLPAPPSTTSSPQIVVPEDINNRLASIDSSLSRIATALEQLVNVLAKTNTS